MLRYVDRAWYRDAPGLHVAVDANHLHHAMRFCSRGPAAHSCHLHGLQGEALVHAARWEGISLFLERV